ncbi:MAG: ATP-dependent Clp protease adaptor ClpS [bacterium]|nr:ATP-dependent Clp protease adaptor ClpS [bacterium]
MMRPDDSSGIPRRKPTILAETSPALPGEGTDIPSQVVLFDDEVHTFAEVVFQLMLATGCSPETGLQTAWEVHTKGKAIAFAGALIECLTVAEILRKISLRVEVQVGS